MALTDTGKKEGHKDNFPENYQIAYRQLFLSDLTHLKKIGDEKI